MDEVVRSRDSVRAMVAQEKRDLADVLRGLTADEWEVESLCAGWRVRDVVAHLLYEATPPLTYGYEVLRARGSADKLNEAYVKRSRTWSISQLSAAFDTTLSGGVATKWQPRVALADLLIHHQDIRRPLNRPRVVPQERLLTVLTHPDPYLRSRRRMQGIRWVATDIDWVYGDGPEIRGPGEAIVMAVAARPSALAELTGAGVQLLQSRLTTTIG